MLDALGFSGFAYDWREHHIPTFDEEIQALRSRRIELVAWWWDWEASDPMATTMLEKFKRHGVTPQLWVMQSMGDGDLSILDEVAALLPVGIQMPKDEAALSALPPDDQERVSAAFLEVISRVHRESLTTSPAEQEQRIEQETDRIGALARLAAPYGCDAALYNHNGWFGMVENEVEIVKRVRQRDVDNVGIAYNFSHARDELHDDSLDFETLWEQMHPYVSAVNMAGIHLEDGTTLYPSQGDGELEMMRIIERSGWSGPIGLIAESGGDAAEALASARAGLDWLAAELREAGSGGPRPFNL
jgi:sugar phosphate isomerase/epimerase